jgi:very-short-patch-repair endonuclease
MALKQRDKDAEIEVLKEMIKGIKVQVKCKISNKIVNFYSEGHRYLKIDD